MNTDDLVWKLATLAMRVLDELCLRILIVMVAVPTYLIAQALLREIGELP